jgi:hypothetical protein
VPVSHCQSSLVSPPPPSYFGYVHALSHFISLLLLLISFLLRSLAHAKHIEEVDARAAARQKPPLLTLPLPPIPILPQGGPPIPPLRPASVAALYGPHAVALLQQSPQNLAQIPPLATSAPGGSFGANPAALTSAGGAALPQSGAEIPPQNGATANSGMGAVPGSGGPGGPGNTAGAGMPGPAGGVRPGVKVVMGFQQLQASRFVDTPVGGVGSDGKVQGSQGIPAAGVGTAAGALTAAGAGTPAKAGAVAGSGTVAGAGTTSSAIATVVAGYLTSSAAPSRQAGAIAAANASASASGPQPSAAGGKAAPGDAIAAAAVAAIAKARAGPIPLALVKKMRRQRPLAIELQSAHSSEQSPSSSFLYSSKPSFPSLS